ncbi:MAG TPA: sigma 54 modulation/S30EA ribosomal C-terminal domain-containing protein [Acidimicrobiales bacterium]|nr:sigma 54 modulation/S30EA ribosomal C-terminal domain-containing protein [Acidimicrobiales bacterium]
MAEGQLQWYDARLNEGRVVKGGREYPVKAWDMAPKARVPGTPVRFDIEREGQVSVAVGVRLRETRGAPAPRRAAGGSPLRRRGRAGTQSAPPVDVVAAPSVPAAAADYARQKLGHALALTHGPVLHARAKLDLAPDPAVERPCHAQVTVDVNGVLVRAHVAAATMLEAVDLLEERLQDQLRHRAEHVEALRHLAAAPGTAAWRHGLSPSVRPSRFPRPVEDRQVVRRKTFAIGEMTVDEAALDMDSLEHDFYLFRELATGADVLLHRLPDGGYGLRRMRVAPAGSSGVTVEVEVESELAPALSLDEARDWLNLTGEPFVFFADRATGRGHVLYHRYDGHYGLIVPADEPAAPAEPTTARRRLRDELERLEAVRAALVAEGLDTESETESLADTASIDQHPADLGTETFEREKDLSLLEDVEQGIADVHRALTRLGHGTYGRCEACDRQIPDERLVARPAARFCLEHQAEAEVIPGLRR